MATPRLAISFLAALVLAPAVVGAQDADATTAEARGLFDAGRAAYEAGRFGAPEVLYNAGRAAERAGQTERAIALYERFLAGAPPAADRVEVEAALARLRPPPVEPAPVPPEPAAPADPPVVETWWFWTLIAAAVLVVGGVSVGVALAVQDPGREAPIPGDVGPGGVVAALQVGWP
jgi:hypothetical protein